MYCWLTVFQVDMYFSMHWLKHCCSPLLKEELGLGMHLEKQCSLSFWVGGLAEVSGDRGLGMDGGEEAGGYIPRSAAWRCSMRLLDELGSSTPSWGLRPRYPGWIRHYRLT